MNQSKLPHLLAALICLILPLTASGQSTARGEATLHGTDAKTMSFTVTFIPKTNAKNPKLQQNTFAVEEGHIYREKAGRKVHVKFAELQAGQRLRVTYLTPLGITGCHLATEIVILPPAKSK